MIKVIILFTTVNSHCTKSNENNLLTKVVESEAPMNHYLHFEKINYASNSHEWIVFVFYNCFKYSVFFCFNNYIYN